MRKLRKFLYLSGDDRQLLGQTWVLLGSVRLGLALLPFQTLQSILTKLAEPPADSLPIRAIELGKIVWAVNLSSRYMPGGAKCLARALTTQTLMCRHGYAPQLKIGVAKGETGQLEAHAWVENQGQVVIGALRDLSRFIPMPSFKGDQL